MKVFKSVFMILFFSLFFMACSNTVGNKKVTTVTDKDSVVKDGDVIETDTDAVSNDKDSVEKKDATNDETQDQDIIVTNDNPLVDETQDEVPDTSAKTCKDTTCQKNAHCEMQNNNPECVCDNGFHLNSGSCISDSGVTKTGTFSLDFDGPTNDMGGGASGGSGGGGMPQAGEGTVKFSHLGKDITYSKNGFFPTAVYDNKTDPNKPTLNIMWVEKMTLGKTKFFGLIIPKDNLKTGNVPFGASNPPTVAIYGDVTLSKQGITINCVRSFSNISTSVLNIKKFKDSSIKLTSHGELVDPAIVGSALKYPICSE